MTIIERNSAAKRVIDLAGPEGNAFVLLGLAKQYAKQLHEDAECPAPEAVLAEMQAGDYEHLIEVFDKYFGDYVDLMR